MGTEEQLTFDSLPVIKGYPELRWTGKRPYRSTLHYPAQLKESFGEPIEGWMNKLYWGDNLQVMSHLLRQYRGKIQLVYIDPPFDSKADYKKKIVLKKQTISGDSLAFEEKQYGDIWSSDEYLQFMYERLILLRELLCDTGSIVLHCDWHRSAHLKLIMDEVFGPNNFHNEIVYCYSGGGVPKTEMPRKHDTLYWYTKGSSWIFNTLYRSYSEGTMQRGRTAVKGENAALREEGTPLNDWWTDVKKITSPTDPEKLYYPTQKSEELLDRIISMFSNPGDLVFDCFMGSGTTQAVAMRLGRRFLGADINIGAIQTTEKRLLRLARKLSQRKSDLTLFTSTEFYNVNNYDFFRNPVEARDLLIQALDIQPFSQGHVYDGELDGRMVKLLPTNRIASKADISELVANLPYAQFDARKAENPNEPVERITLVCMGHEPDLKAALEQELGEYKVDIEVLDVLRDRSDLQLKREAEADVAIEDGKLVIKGFWPMNLLQKLSMNKESVDDWREMVESVLIDWNYDGAVMEPSVIDIPEDKNGLVLGAYDVPVDAGTVRVKITDVLSESLEVEVRA